MSVTLHDVAHAADVSIKTVSNVVRGQGNFSQATKERVEQAIEKLGYRPNLAARGLRSGRLGVIGLVVPDIRNPYFAELADAVMRVSAEHDLLVVIEQSDGEQATELELLRGRATRMMDGVLFSVLGLSDAPTELTDSITKPVVILGEPVPGWATDYVSMNDREGVRTATGHLLEQGRRRIAVLGAHPEERIGTAQLRLAGYRRRPRRRTDPIRPDPDRRHRLLGTRARRRRDPQTPRHRHPLRRRRRLQRRPRPRRDASPRGGRADRTRRDRRHRVRRHRRLPLQRPDPHHRPTRRPRHRTSRSPIPPRPHGRPRPSHGPRSPCAMRPRGKAVHRLDESRQEDRAAGRLIFESKRRTSSSDEVRHLLSATEWPRG